MLEMLAVMAVVFILSLIFILCFKGYQHYFHSLNMETDVVRWINATHGVLLAINNRNLNIYGGLRYSKSHEKSEREFMEEWWGVTDKDSLLSMIEWLMNEGHRIDYQGDKKEVAAWDYSRALWLLASGYLCGYIPRDVALNFSLDIAKYIQPQYDSWDDFFEGYFKGYEIWAGESSEERRKIFHNLKTKVSNSPYQLPWDLELKKDWE